MNSTSLHPFITAVLKNMPSDWIGLTTHRLDIYNEEKAKSEFLTQFENLYKQNITDTIALKALPTAYDYIRLGHPLSSVLEWAIAQETNLAAENIISFGSQTMPLLAILRTNKLATKKTRILFESAVPSAFDAQVLKEVYHFDFETLTIQQDEEISDFDGSTVLVRQQKDFNLVDEMRGDTLSRKRVHEVHDQRESTAVKRTADFYLDLYNRLGSVLIITQENSSYISDIQHVRRRETVAMTPADALTALQSFASQKEIILEPTAVQQHKTEVIASIKEITNTKTTPIVGSSGLSVQYAIMMGLIDDAQQQYPEKPIRFVVPPNCYGGTNDQARRVAACTENVTIVDLPVDGDNDMVRSVDRVLEQIAQEDAISYIIAEIPTNPRVEVPNLEDLRAALSKPRKTAAGSQAVDPVFILDQTFCPNVHFLGEENILSSVRALAYASGSKFPSGGKCTAGYCAANDKASGLMEKLHKHLALCDNEATTLQYELLADQMPSMNNRITAAYENTRKFVTYIENTLPEAKINFVSEELAQQGFTPSVFSMDLPTKGNTHTEREAYKRDLNLKLINKMITEIPDESKYCVSYGQLKGVYWTVPATSTQGTTKEGDKDYIIRASLSPAMDLEKHKEVFADFVTEL